MIKLKELRESKGLRQQDVADFFNVSQNAISNWESGYTEPDIQTLIKISRYFEVTVDYLIGAEEIELSKMTENLPALKNEEIELIKELRAISHDKSDNIIKIVKIAINL